VHFSGGGEFGYSGEITASQNRRKRLQYIRMSGCRASSWLSAAAAALDRPSVGLSAAARFKRASMAD
jgi:hypothetical protein